MVKHLLLPSLFLALGRRGGPGAGAMDRPESVYREEDDEEEESGEEGQLYGVCFRCPSLRRPLRLVVKEASGRKTGAFIFRLLPETGREIA